ncbi:MAG: MerR family transcriptional regulator [Chloroflexi bacterium]|jgi:DNA-binding transcriptional MerR regulator|nr:MerR family transcriptional regulator [Chloroflexota bacterium]
MSSISNYSTAPHFTIKAVQARTGIKPVTLRAWERRYELLEPTRLKNGYRLYSEQDVQLLLWVKSRLDSGMSISQVVKQFNDIRENGAWPESVQKVEPELPRLKPPMPARDYAEIMLSALIAHNETRLLAVVDEMRKYFDLITIFEEIVQPSVALLEHAWYQGGIPMATVHVSTQHIKSKLLNLMTSLPVVREGALTLLGSGPGETKELDVLMLAVLMRQAGFFVEYLGQDLPIEDILDYSHISKPKFICLYVGEEATAYLMRDFASQLAKLSTKPRLLYFGRYLDDKPAVQEKLGGTYLGKTLTEGLETIRKLVSLGVVQKWE